MESKVGKVEDKPDIFQLAIKYQERAHPSKRALMGAGYYDGYDDCWTDHVETLKQKIKELEAEITRLKDEKAP